MFRVRSLIVWLALLVPTTPAFAYDLHEGVAAGLQVALNLSAMNLPEDDRITRLVHSGAGLGFAIRGGLGDWFSLESGLGYQVRGTKFEDVEYAMEDRPTRYFMIVRVRLNYLAVPVLANVHVPVSEGELRFTAGAEAAYLVSGRVTLVGEINDARGNVSTGLLPDERESFDAGLVAGIGFDIPVGDEAALGFDARGYLGLLDTLTVPVTQLGDETSKVRSLGLVVTYWLPQRW